MSVVDAALSATVLNATTSLCRTCRRSVPAELREQDGRIVMHKACPEHGDEQVLIASDAAWYHRTLAHAAVLQPPRGEVRPVQQGCPFDCGTCASHQQRVQLPVVPITSACNLDCPICYTINKNDGAYHMDDAEFDRVLDVIRAQDPGRTLINITGGEPTQHPHLARLVRRCHEEGIHRVTLSTHGLAFLHDEALLDELARARARIVLSFNSFDKDTNFRMLGANVLEAKLRVLERLEQRDIDTTLIPVLALGVNDHEIGSLIDFAFAKRFIRSLEIHTMTFTGQGGRGFDAGARITPPDVLRAIEQQTGGRITMADFVPSPSAHPLCYQTCYLLETADAGLVPFLRFMSPATQRELLRGHLYMEPGEPMERVLQGVIDELWAAEQPGPADHAVLAALKALLRAMFPPAGLPYAQQQQLAERSAKAIYVHSHMDEASFDTDRIRQCCVAVPQADGAMIPTCSYNILYRERDRRFATRAPQDVVRFVDGRTFRR